MLVIYHLAISYLLVDWCSILNWNLGSSVWNVMRWIITWLFIEIRAGAEAMVVQSSSCTNDKLYQSLSVTAHQWLPMKEVRPWKMEEYLTSMRIEGYTLVGVEQTAQSVCLTKYRYDKVI